MGIHGIFKEIGPGQRISLAKLSADHFVAHNRPFRLAIDISIWLFQIQAGKGGSNPALRTFYYRLLRLLTLNIHPLFVFDGPNKPLFKRNKKVGGPGVRVASVPEFLAKQLLKQFGFPWHVAPGEAEAECALLQREAVVDAVLSEDVDTLMFGSGVTLKNWSAENSTKTPTHVNVYRAEETKERSGMDRDGMILVALMSGGDYITEGIPGWGPKFACDAARAGYGKDLCAIRKKDAAGFAAWREKLQHQIRTNEQKIFSRKNANLTIPDGFPDLEVLGYYTQPCVSTLEKLARLRETLEWDQEIDFPALRSFAADAFDWRCLGGAKKFIRNLAPAMLVRELRLLGERNLQLSQGAQEGREKQYVSAIHGKRNHNSTDGALEYRVSFIPMNLVPIDLSIEDEDDEFIPAGTVEDQSDAENEFAILPSGTAEDGGPSSPTKKRTVKPYEPNQPEKVWMMRSFLRAGCPMLAEEYENSMNDPVEVLKRRQKGRAAPATSTVGSTHTKKSSRKKKVLEPQAGAIVQYGTIIKASQVLASEPSSSQEAHKPLRKIAGGPNARAGRSKPTATEDLDNAPRDNSGFKLPSAQIPPSLRWEIDAVSEDDAETPKANRQASLQLADTRGCPSFEIKKSIRQSTPRGRKRLSDEDVSPAMSQMTISSYYSPSPRKFRNQPSEVVDLLSSSPSKLGPQASTPSPPCIRHIFVRDSVTELSRNPDLSPDRLPESVTKRRTKVPLRRTRTAPTDGVDEIWVAPLSHTLQSSASHVTNIDTIKAINLKSTLTRKDTLLVNTDLNEEAAPIPSLTSHSNTASARHLGNALQPQPTASSMLLENRKTAPKLKAAGSSSSSTQPLQLRRSSPRQQPKKKRIQLRESLEGAWRETEVEELDLSGDGSGWRHSHGRAKLPSWRKSGIEVLDLTGA